MVWTLFYFLKIIIIQTIFTAIIALNRCFTLEEHLRVDTISFALIKMASSLFCVDTSNIRKANIKHQISQFHEKTGLHEDMEEMDSMTESQAVYYVLRYF